MSAEEYFQNNPADASFTTHVKDKKPAHKSPPVFIAEELMKKAAEGIRRASARQVPLNTLDTNAMLFSSMLLAIDRMIWDRVFDIDDMMAGINATLLGRLTFAKNPKLTQEGPVQITQGEWEVMMKTAREDKTYAAFFENTNLLPASARVFFDTDRVTLPGIRANILPKYKPLAALATGQA
jgi:hypothetical protein